MSERPIFVTARYRMKHETLAERNIPAMRYCAHVYILHIMYTYTYTYIYIQNTEYKLAGVHYYVRTLTGGGKEGEEASDAAS